MEKGVLSLGCGEMRIVAHQNVAHKNICCCHNLQYAHEHGDRQGKEFKTSFTIQTNRPINQQNHHTYLISCASCGVCEPSLGCASPIQLQATLHWRRSHFQPLQQKGQPTHPHPNHVSAHEHQGYRPPSSNQAESLLCFLLQRVWPSLSTLPS